MISSSQAKPVDPAPRLSSSSSRHQLGSSANQAVQRTGASRFRSGQIQHYCRLAPVADLHVAGSYEREEMVPANVADEPPVLCHGAMVRRPPCPGHRASVRSADASLGRHYQGLPCVRRRRQTRRMEPPGWTLFPALGCPTPGGSSATLGVNICARALSSRFCSSGLRPRPTSFPTSGKSARARIWPNSSTR